MAATHVAGPPPTSQEGTRTLAAIRATGAFRPSCFGSRSWDGHGGCLSWLQADEWHDADYGCARDDEPLVRKGCGTERSLCARRNPVLILLHERSTQEAGESPRLTIEATGNHTEYSDLDRQLNGPCAATPGRRPFTAPRSPVTAGKQTPIQIRGQSAGHRPW
jgi:hypothetical protein